MALVVAVAGECECIQHHIIIMTSFPHFPHHYYFACKHFHSQNLIRVHQPTLTRPRKRWRNGENYICIYRKKYRITILLALLLFLLNLAQCYECGLDIIPISA